MRLKIIEEKLTQLSDDYARVYPKFIVAEQAYMLKEAELLMSQSVMGLASQPLRDAQTKRLLSQTEEYVEYYKVLPEIKIIDAQRWIWDKIATLNRWVDAERD